MKPSFTIYEETAMSDSFQVHSIGWVRKEGNEVRIDIETDFREGLLGLEDFSHIIVCYWFHENDNPEDRRRLRVYPRKNPSNPLTGVFATHAPVRPNLIGMTTCRVISVTGTTIRIDAIDARNGTPVIDIKGYLPDPLKPSEIRAPDWVSGSR
jgi:tRNA-Thr(GGU) m(6)t(6)A37 methyltransferase TsaA